MNGILATIKQLLGDAQPTFAAIWEKRSIYWLVPVASLMVGKLIFSSTRKRIKGKSTKVAVRAKQIVELNDLPPDVLAVVLNLLPGDDLLRLCRVNRYFNDFINNDPSLWKHLIQLEWEEVPASTTQSYKQLYTENAKAEAARLNFAPGRYIISVMENCAEFTPATEWQDRTSSDWWRRRFLAEMGGVELCKLVPHADATSGDVVLLSNGTKIAWYRFVDINDACKKFKGHPFLSEERTECPFLGNTVGFINFDVVSSPTLKRSTSTPVDQNAAAVENDAVTAAIAEFVRVCIYETRGVIARLDTQFFCNSVYLEEVALEEALSKYGLCDGDALLDSDKNSPYMQYTLNCIQQQLDNLPETGAQVYYVETCHNPIRLHGLGDTSLLSGKSVFIWLMIDAIKHTKISNKLWGTDRIKDGASTA